MGTTGCPETSLSKPQSTPRKIQKSEAFCYESSHRLWNLKCQCFSQHPATGPHPEKERRLSAYVIRSEETCFDSGQEREIFIFCKASTPKLCPTELPKPRAPKAISQGEKNGRSLNLTTSFRLVPVLRLHGVIRANLP